MPLSRRQLTETVNRLKNRIAVLEKSGLPADRKTKETVKAQATLAKTSYSPTFGIAPGGGGAPFPMGPSGPSSSINIGDVGGALVGAGACDHLDGIARTLCKAAGGLFGGGSGGGTSGGGGGFQAGQETCPTGTIRVMGKCVAPGDAFPGGDPFITEAGGQAVQGAFGLPAITPVIEQRTHRSCPSGMVLGKDNYCYPKAVLSRRSRFRKWRQGMKPLLTGGDRKAIRKAERVANKLKSEQKRLRSTKNALNKVL